MAFSPHPFTRSGLLALVLLLVSLGPLASGPVVPSSRSPVVPARGAALPALIRGISYEASDGGGMAFKAALTGIEADGRVSCRLEGPGAGDAAVTASATRLPHGVVFDWSVRCGGSKRDWNRWMSGFRLEFAREATGVSTQPGVKWVRPTGAHPWEVPGDTLYPDTACQIRAVRFGDQMLAIVTSLYDPDWIYGNDKGRAPFVRFSPPDEPSGEARLRMALLWVPAGKLDATALAAEALGEPLALGLATDRLGNLFRPGEPARFECVVGNTTDRAQSGTLTLDAWSYRGERLLHATEEIRLPPSGRRVLAKELRPKERGVVFIVARLAWEGGETWQRTTLGVLPERRAEGTRPESPFALAAVIAAPERYPDQRPMEKVLPLVERIGARWLRWGGVPLKSGLTAEDEAKVRERAALLAKHGILGYAHPAAAVPKPEEREAFEARVSEAVRRLRWGNPFLEIGNEINYGAKAPEYVERMLRPIHTVMRRDWPEGKIVSMGLGGVHKPWFDEFVEAGGMELIDVLSVHPGCHPRAPEYYEGWEGWVFRTQMRDALHAARRFGKEVWIDEAYAPTPPGRSQVDLRTSADYLVRTHVCSIALGVKLIAWYQFQDGVWFAQRPRPDDVEYSFGIVTTDLAPKPAYVAYAAMTEQLEGALCKGRLDLGADDLYGFRFLKDGQTLNVFWSYREKHETDLPWWPPEKYKDSSRKPGEPWQERWNAPVTLSLPATEALAATDLMGNPVALRPEGGRVALKLTGSPLYVRGLGDIPRLPRVWPEMP